jgi:hypothetical protein
VFRKNIKYDKNIIFKGNARVPGTMRSMIVQGGLRGLDGGKGSDIMKHIRIEANGCGIPKDCLL